MQRAPLGGDRHVRSRHRRNGSRSRHSHSPQTSLQATVPRVRGEVPGHVVNVEVQARNAQWEANRCVSLRRGESRVFLAFLHRRFEWAPAGRWRSQSRAVPCAVFEARAAKLEEMAAVSARGSGAAESGPDARRARRSDRSIAGGYVRIRTAEAQQRRWSAIGGALIWRGAGGRTAQRSVAVGRASRAASRPPPAPECPTGPAR